MALGEEEEEEEERRRRRRRNKAALERGHVVSAAIVLDLMADLDLKVIP